MDSQSLVSSTERNVCDETDNTETSRQVVTTTSKQKVNSSIVSQDETDGMSLVRKKYKKEGHSNSAIRMLMKGWRKSTRTQYQVYLKMWSKFCIEKQYCDEEYIIKNCVEFLLHLYKKKKCGYSAINTARSALSCLFDTPPIGDTSVIKRFMRSIFNCRPSKPRYHKI